ncbi:hypothetical protein [Helicobacter bilis]|uniref:hypothetical protein n=1 Tax=Helicobacter bilis TaxID=37372 RepID=UPI002557D004|nr:hypothetical protein [Helicobacter bilis]
MPPKLALDELDEKGWDTIGKMADLAKGLSSPELAGFLAGFQGAIREAHHKTPSSQAEMDNNKFAQLVSKKIIGVIKTRSEKENGEEDYTYFILKTADKAYNSPQDKF